MGVFFLAEEAMGVKEALGLFGLSCELLELLGGEVEHSGELNGFKQRLQFCLRFILLISKA